jgi:hypothetical protein
VDRGGKLGVTRSQAPFVVATHPDGSLARRESAILHRRDYSHRQHGNARRKAKPSGCSGQFISSAKSSLNLRFVTQRFRKYFTVYSSLSEKFRHYFDAYNILVVSNFPLADILHNQDATGRISKWAVELGALTLVDFMAQW